MAIASTTSTTGEYLEAIYMLDDEGQVVISARLAELLHVSRPTVSDTLKRLMEQGLIVFGEHKEIVLTPKGRDTAEALMRRHRLVERWLTDVLGMGWAEADAEAHQLEHALSAKVEVLLNKHLGYPSTCPHGNRIPGNPPPADKDWQPLTQKKTGYNFTVKRVAEPVENAASVLQSIEARGLIPGAQGTLMDREPHDGALTVKIGERVVSVSHYLASNIYVI